MPSLRQSKLFPSGLARPRDISIRFTVLLVLACGLFLALLPWMTASAMQATGAYITVSYGEPINVRAGPSSFDYPIIGILPKDGTAPAIGRSPKGEWIQIEFSAGPKGVGWVYAANVSLSSGSLLPVVEPPPTATPATTPTINPTYAAALAAVPTSTRKPTFTAPPPLQLPTYVNRDPKPSRGLHTGWIIIGLGAAGLLGMAISSLRRR